MKIKKQQVNFTQIANDLLNDSRISAKAKGIYSYIFSKPDNWDFSIERIQDDFTDGVKALSSGIKELEKYGYLKREKQSNGRNIYFVYQTSQEIALPSKTADSQNVKKPKRQKDKTEGISNKENIKNKEEISNKDTTTSSSESTDSTNSTDLSLLKDKRHEDVQAIIDVIVWRHGVIDGKKEENRQFSYLLSEKIKKIPGFKENFNGITDFMERLLRECPSYMVHNTTSPTKIYYNLGAIVAAIRSNNEKNNKPKNTTIYG